ncbi:MAG: hypothetical protein JJ850_10700 [Kordiimonadaceae bacterium]|nr:hypothetical protein [Kordiimonadaceae bacterium]MBO6568945.1 hypothetical protein [Kordiimonadaceae bacterium]MBO6965080.1 hypothetical protein [Kordiimonadaceae bacterium]
MAAKVFTRDQIMAVLPDVDLVSEIASGFAAYSAGKVDVPPVGELLFPENRGELHIKYGAIKGEDRFVIKVATGFFDNPTLGLPPFGGCMLVMSQKTGAVEAVLLEEGELTNHRTAAAGALAAKYLAPKTVSAIGIIGSGVQARLQADYLRQVTDCRTAYLWARDAGKAKAAAADITEFGFNVTVTSSVREVCENSNLIVTTTPANSPLVMKNMVKPGTHITAMGSDSPAKGELDPALLASADVVAVDSLSQCKSSGELHHALTAGLMTETDALELGTIINGQTAGRKTENDITIADLTGVAVQDIIIACVVLEKLE